jgi:hypothetical protein
MGGGVDTPVHALTTRTEENPMPAHARSTPYPYPGPGTPNRW